MTALSSLANAVRQWLGFDLCRWSAELFVLALLPVDVILVAAFIHAIGAA